jgi:hypothetical protein
MWLISRRSNHGFGRSSSGIAFASIATASIFSS